MHSSGLRVHLLSDDIMNPHPCHTSDSNVFYQGMCYTYESLNRIPKWILSRKKSYYQGGGKNERVRAYISQECWGASFRIFYTSQFTLFPVIFNIQDQDGKWVSCPLSCLQLSQLMAEDLFKKSFQEQRATWGPLGELAIRLSRQQFSNIPGHTASDQAKVTQAQLLLHFSVQQVRRGSYDLMAT